MNNNEQEKGGKSVRNDTQERKKATVRSMEEEKMKICVLLPFLPFLFLLVQT
jgi:hypothetical protein